MLSRLLLHFDEQRGYWRNGYTTAKQPCGEIFVMKWDGTEVEQLTDNQWEDGGPASQPHNANPGPAIATSNQHIPNNAAFSSGVGARTDLIERTYQNLPSDIRARFDGRFANTPLSFEFRPEASRNQIIVRIPGIFRELVD